MTSIQTHRKNKELMGKELSANTIASFLAAQSVRSTTDLHTNRPMSSALLLFLNRQKAMEYWQSNGWTRQEQSNFYLTECGLEEIALRESNQAMNISGRRKAGNVDPMLIAAALRFIETGNLSDTENDVEVLSEIFEI